MTKEELKAEILACGRDPNYFIKKYVRISHPIRGLIPFETYDYQEELVRSYRSHRFNVVLKARQLGVSEITAAYATWLILFHPQKNVLVMATKSETAKNIVKKVRTALVKLPKWLLVTDITTDNKLSLELGNGSQIKALTTSEDAGRSEAVSLLIVDEAAFVTNLRELWTGLQPTVSAGGKAIVLSTPNGVGNMFHKMYTEAESGDNNFHRTKLMWWVHPDRSVGLQDDPDQIGGKTSPWFENEVAASNMSPRDIAQELCCDFIASGDTFIPGLILTRIYEGTREPVEKGHWDRNLWTWEAPQVGHRYIVTADVSRGDGRDNSVAEVWDVEGLEQKAEYYGKIPVEEFARLLCELGEAYNHGAMFVENNNVGTACLEHVKLIGYDSLYYMRKGDHRPGEVLNSKWGVTDADLIAGFTTTPRNRPLLMSKLEEFTRREGLIGIRSRRLQSELKTFIWNNGRPEAMRGKNDDAVVATAIACWMKDTFITPNASREAIGGALIKAMSKTEHKNTQIPGASKDPTHQSQRALGIFTSGPESINDIQRRLKFRPVGRHGEMDLRWLLKG